MRKIKKLFQSHENQDAKAVHPNQQQKQLQSCIVQTMPSEIQISNSVVCQNCKNCNQNHALISKYLNLIKLLKIKIDKLEKQVKQSQIQKQKDGIQDFNNFNIELDTTSIITLKNNTQKIMPSLKILVLTKENQAVESQIVVDKTVKKSQNIINENKRKSFKKFVSQLNILEQQFQNQKENQFKAYKSSKNSKQKREKKKNKQMPTIEFTKTISFKQLMEKSNISFKSSNDMYLSSKSKNFDLSSIKCINKNSCSNNSNGQLSLKTQSKANLTEEEIQYLKAKTELFQNRIKNLSETILDLKSFFMHVRHSIYQFVKMSDIIHLKKKQNKAYFMLSIIIRIFEFSQDEMFQMIQEKQLQSKKNKIKELIKMAFGKGNSA